MISTIIGCGSSWHILERHSSLPGLCLPKRATCLDFSVDAQLDFLEWAYRGGLRIHELGDIDLERVIALTKKYRDRPMDLSDASLIVTSELLGIVRSSRLTETLRSTGKRTRSELEKHLVQIENPERHNKSLKPTPYRQAYSGA